MSSSLNFLRPYVSDSCPFYSNYSDRFSVKLTFPSTSEFTKQEFKDECDINVLMAKYQSSGEMPVLNQTSPQYLDATGFDYQEHMQFVAGAQSLFNELPSSVRNRFGNDPGQFLDFTSDERNRDEMSQMGLLKPVSEWVQPPLPVPSAGESLSQPLPLNPQSLTPQSSTEKKS